MVIEPDILNYIDFKIYLADLYAHRKDVYPKYSYRKLAEDFGFKPTNFFYLLIQGKRKLTFEALHKIVQFSNFSSKQRRYFETLVHYNQTEDESEKKDLEKHLNKIKGKKKDVLSQEKYSYFSHWYIPVIREIISLKGFVPNLTWISRKVVPKISQVTIRETLSILEKLKMIQKKGTKWIQSDEHLSTELMVDSEILGRYHEQLLNLSLLSLEQNPEDRDIGSMTMSLSDEQFQWLVEKVRDFREEIQEELKKQTDSPSKVCLLNMQLFPVSKSLDR